MIAVMRVCSGKDEEGRCRIGVSGTGTGVVFETQVCGERTGNL